MGNNSSKAAVTTPDPAPQHEFEMKEILPGGERVSRRIEEVEANIEVREIIGGGNRVTRNIEEIRLPQYVLTPEDKNIASVDSWMQSLERTSQDSIRKLGDSILEWETILEEKTNDEDSEEDEYEYEDEDEGKFADAASIYQQASWAGESDTVAGELMVESPATVDEEGELVAELLFEQPEWVKEMKKFEEKKKTQLARRIEGMPESEDETIKPQKSSTHISDKATSSKSQTYSGHDYQPFSSSVAAEETEDSKDKKKLRKSTTTNKIHFKHPHKSAKFRSLPNMKCLKANLSNMSLFDKARGRRKTADDQEVETDEAIGESKEVTDFGLPPIPSSPLGGNFPHVELPTQEEVDESNAGGDEPVRPVSTLGYTLSSNVQRRTFDIAVWQRQQILEVVDAGFPPYSTMLLQPTLSTTPLNGSTGSAVEEDDDEEMDEGDESGFHETIVLVERVVEWRERVERESEFVVTTVVDN